MTSIFWASNPNWTWANSEELAQQMMRTGNCLENQAQARTVHTVKRFVSRESILE